MQVKSLATRTVSPSRRVTWPARWRRKPEKMADLMAGIGEVAEELQVVPAPASLIEVVSLFEPDVLVEIEATAVVD